MKKVLSLVTAALVALSFSACSKKNSSSSDKKEIVIGATSVPHAEILEQVKPILEKEGYKLVIKEFTDYQQLNPALDEGELDANFFQHIPYLENSIKEKKYDLTYTVKVHLEPMGLYSKKVKSLDELKDNASIAIPNDPTNESRALKLLEKNGLIKLKNVDLPSKLDIEENSKNIDFKELDASQLPRTLDDVDASVINSNYAMEAGLVPTKDAIIIEEKDVPYANVIAVRTKDKDKPYIKALSKAITSPEIKKFIEDKYKGSIIPSF